MKINFTETNEKKEAILRKRNRKKEAGKRSEKDRVKMKRKSNV